jgi:tRNA modification GTPase
LGGAFSKEIEALRDQLVNLRMLVEATLDFPEEEIDFLEKANARGRLDKLAITLDGVLGQARQGALLREGLQVVLAGQPNAGKSSLLNALAGAELAIVTPIAGTTRDKVSETIQIEGVPLHVIDTAGLRADHEASDEVERIGMARSWEAIAQADAVLFLHDLTRVGVPAYAQADADIATRLPEGVPVVHVFNKADAATLSPALQTQAQPQGPTLAVSARTGDGLQVLRQTLLEIAGWQAAPEGVFIARQRHVQALRVAREHLHNAQAHAALNDGALDLLAEELRLAHNALGTITGAFSADDLLGEIFTRFCIGK